MNLEAFVVVGGTILIGLVALYVAIYLPCHFLVKWLSRKVPQTLKVVFGLLLAVALSGMFFYIAIHGLEEGQIPFGGKFQHALVPRSSYPKLYWFAEFWYFGLTIFGIWFAFHGFRRVIATVRGKQLVTRENAAQQAVPADAARPAGSRRG